MGPVFLVLIVLAVLIGIASGRADALTLASVQSAKGAVTLSIGLVGVMSFWLGLVEVLKRAGALEGIARALRPVFSRLFPDVPAGHPALAAVTMNIAANMLGLVNAATPLGISAMRQLDRLNGRKGTATDAMCLFLAINTSAVALVPSGVIAIRAGAGSIDPAGIILTTLVATSCSTLAALAAVMLLSRLPYYRKSRPPVVVDENPEELADENSQPAASWQRRRVPWALGAVIGVLGVAVAALVVADIVGAPGGVRLMASALPLPLIILVVMLYGWARGVPVYGALVEGGREGFQVALRIIPYMVAIFVAIGMLRASGALEAVVGFIGPWTQALGLPGEALPMALLRPFSGSGAFAVMSETLSAHGPDSFVGYLVSTMQGSTETTFYVLAVYGGEVALRRTRHALPACLIADFCGLAAAIAACHLLL